MCSDRLIDWLIDLRNYYRAVRHRSTWDLWNCEDSASCNNRSLKLSLLSRCDSDYCHVCQLKVLFCFTANYCVWCIVSGSSACNKSIALFACRRTESRPPQPTYAAQFSILRCTPRCTLTERRSQPLTTVLNNYLLLYLLISFLHLPAN